LAAQSDSKTTLPSEALNQELPKWIRFSGEERMRFEGYTGLLYKPGNDDYYLLNRARFNLTLRPLPWLKFFAQTQDARVFWRNTTAAPPYQDTWDLRQAYVELGDSDKSHFGLRVGRQELLYGDERLLGPATWSNTTRTFDAARLLLREGNYKLDVFASSVVVLTDGEVGSVQAGNNLHGLWGGIANLIPGGSVEPFVLWRVQPRVKSELGHTGNMDVKIGGIYWGGKAKAWDYSGDVVFQHGDYAGDRVAAFGEHWITGYSFKSKPMSPRFALEYNYASGDKDPKDGRRGTFDSLYASVHDKIGFADQIGWKNIHHGRVFGEIRTLPKLQLSGRYNIYWLADPHDALYTAQGAVVSRQSDGSAGRWVGQEVDFIVTYPWTKFAQVSGGVSRIIPGTFLERTTPGHSYTSPYVSITTQF
jgi:hypothetical protein